MGGDLGESLNFGLSPKEGDFFGNRYFLCHFEEETIDHILLHYAKTWILWQLLFSLFEVTWVLSYSVRETLIGWHGFFVGEALKKSWKVALLCIFWTVWKGVSV